MKTEPMNPVVKAKWLEALRSGEYKQADGVLRTTEDSYCCLGVLSQIASDEGIVAQPKQRNGYGHYRWTDDDGTTGYMYLLPSVAEWAGLDSASGRIEDGTGGHVCLSQMNDDGSTFTEIANVIEERL